MRNSDGSSDVYTSDLPSQRSKEDEDLACSTPQLYGGSPRCLCLGRSPPCRKRSVLCQRALRSSSLADRPGRAAPDCHAPWHSQRSPAGWIQVPRVSSDVRMWLRSALQDRPHWRIATAASPTACRPDRLHCRSEERRGG